MLFAGQNFSHIEEIEALGTYIFCAQASLTCEVNDTKE